MRSVSVFSVCVVCPKKVINVHVCELSQVVLTSESLFAFQHTNDVL